MQSCLNGINQLCSLVQQNKKLNLNQQEQVYILLTDLQNFLDKCTPQTLDKSTETILFKSIGYLSGLGNPTLTIRLICRCINKLYKINPTTMIPTASSKLLQILDQHSNLSRDPKKFNEINCLLFSIGELYTIQSHLVPSIFNLMTNNLFWRLWKLNDDGIKVATMELCRRYISNSKKRIKNEWTEYYKMIVRGSQETSAKVRIAAGELMLTIAEYYTKPTDVSLKIFESSLSLCVKAMEDPEEEVREIYSKASAQLLLSVLIDVTDEENNDANNSGSQQQGMGAMLGLAKKKSTRTLYTCSYALMVATGPFTKIGQSKELRSSISNCVIYYFSKCPETVLIRNMDTIVRNLVGLISISSSNVTSSDKRIAQTYVTKMISVGLIDRLTEAGRMELLTNLVQLVIKNIVVSNENCFMTVLYCIGKLCKVLGECIAKYRDSILDAILYSLKHSVESVRYVGTLAIKQLMEALPSHSIGLISALMNMVQIDHAELATASKKDENIKSFANSLHGHSSALAALITVSAKHSLTISHSLCSAVLDTACLLGKAARKDNDDLYVSMKRQEACWMLVCSVLSLNDYWVKHNLEKILELWDETLSGKYEEPITYSTKEEDITYRLRARACCLLSLQVFITNCHPLLTPERMNLIFGYISSTIELLSSLPSNFKPTTSVGLYSINLLKMNLFNLVGKLPEVMLAYTPSVDSKLQLPQHRHIINFITKMAFAEADATIPESVPIKTSLIESMVDLKVKLEPIERKSTIITVDSLDPSCILFDELSNLYYSESVYLKLPPLPIRLVDSSIRLLGKLFIYHKPNSKAQIIEHLVQQVKTVLANTIISNTSSASNTRRGLEDDLTPPDLSLVVFSNVVASVYCILRNLEVKSEDNKKHKFYANIHSILNAALGFADPFVRAAASECLHSFGKLIGLILLEDLIKRCTQKITTAGPELKSGLALALGSVNRSVGSIKGRTLLPSTVSFLVALSKVVEEDIQRNSLISLYHTIDTNGVAFVPHTESVIQHLFQLLFESTSHITLLLSYLCKVLYALIGLGPELLQLKTQPFNKIFNYFLSELMDASLSSELYNTDALIIELIRLFQRSILFTPYLIEDYEGIVSFLKKILLSNQEQIYIENIQNEVGQCIKIICDQKPELILKYFSPQELIDIVDSIDFVVARALTYNSLSQSSKDSYIAGNNQENHFKNIITSLISSKLVGPKVWIDLVHSIVSSEIKSLKAEETQSDMLNDTDEKEETVIEEKKSSPTGPMTYCWQTKVFAMKCLQSLFEIYKSDKNHIDLSLARNDPTTDYLVLHLGKIIDICCIATNKGSPSVQHAGLVLMINVTELFGDMIDPDIQGEVLLQQHTTRFITAISESIVQVNNPLLVYVACQLSALFIPSKMLRNQTKLMSRMCSYLVNYITDPKALNNANQGEVAICMIRVSILSALAEIYIAAETDQNKELLEILKPNLQEMFVNWYRLLQDYSNLSIIVTDDDDRDVLIKSSSDNYSAIYEQAEDNLHSFYFVELGTERNVLYYYKQAYPSVLNAITLARMKYASDSEFEDVIEEMDYNDSLLLGLSVSGLYGMDKRNILKAIRCLLSISQIIPSKEFKQHHHAIGATFEIILLLIEIQGIRDMKLQNTCIELLEKILTEINLQTLSVSDDQVSKQAIVTTSTEVCLKPLKLHFPYLFKQDSEFELGNFEFDKDQKELIKKSTNCLKTIITKLDLSITGANIATLLYTICRVTQFTKSNVCLDAAAAMIEWNEKLQKLQSSDDSSKENDERQNIWRIALNAAIESIRNRLLLGKISSSYDLELLFILLSSSSCSNIQVHEKAIQAISTCLITNISLLQQEESNKTQRVEVIVNILNGLQNGILNLARNGLAKLSCFYTMRIVETISLQLIYEDKLLRVDIIDKIAPSSLNILLAGFSLLTELENNSKNQIQSYLSILIPVLVKFTRFARDNKLNKLFALGVQCFERLAKVAPEHFKNMISSQLLATSIVQEIQGFASQLQQNSEKHATPQKTTASRQPKKKLTMNF
ncbi:hypothetical protein ABK040_002138 [Willaertia magna]